MYDWIQLVINGLLQGGLYGLIGLGLALMFGVMKLVNIAHGECMVLAAYGAWFLFARLPLMGWWLAVPLVLAAAMALGWAVQALLLGPALRSGDPMRPLLISFGLSVVLRNLMVELFGADPRSLPGGAMLQSGFAVGGVTIGVFPLGLLLLALLLFLALHLLLRHSRFGRIVRASADRPETVRLMGVSPERAYRWVAALSLGFAALSGLLLGLRGSFTPFSGAEQLLTAFEVVIIGGLGSLWGAFVGGLALGVAQLLGLKLDPNAGALYSHLLFLLILLLYPKGLSGGRA
jgi:branched-chain amino acid transport system permease protein